MKTRFFYAAEIYRTWPKLFVLTEDGVLYSEFLHFMKPATERKNVNFETFKAEGYLWGGYQTLVEIDEETAKSKELRQQENWIGRYLEDLILTAKP